MNWKETLNPYMSTGEATFYRRFLHILKHFLIVIVGAHFSPASYPIRFFLTISTIRISSALFSTPPSFSPAS